MFSLSSRYPRPRRSAVLGRKVDTARHHGVPNGCVLELDLLAAPPESSDFDPFALIAGGGKPLLLRDTVSAIHRAAEDPRVSGLIARVQIPAAPAGPVRNCVRRSRRSPRPNPRWRGPRRIRARCRTTSHRHSARYGCSRRAPSALSDLPPTRCSCAVHWTRSASRRNSSLVVNTSLRQTVSRRIATRTPIAKLTADWWKACTPRCGRR